ncbi:hypothetical protein AMJ86_00785 [bacterium SM23_57]|nr:MAG: hypothetical protein AMJ86_00785 [bacterium SM23_57]
MTKTRLNFDLALDADYHKGGVHIVGSLPELLTIPSEVRSEGMIVWVKDIEKAYQLIGGVSDLDWELSSMTAVPKGGGAGTALVKSSATDFDTVWQVISSAQNIDGGSPSDVPVFGLVIDGGNI